jgi:hypothetical protein
LANILLVSTTSTAPVAWLVISQEEEDILIASLVYQALFRIQQVSPVVFLVPLDCGQVVQWQKQFVLDVQLGLMVS